MSDAQKFKLARAGLGWGIASTLVEGGYPTPKVIKMATDDELQAVLKSQDDLDAVRAKFPQAA
jgi:hypothetical protein